MELFAKAMRSFPVVHFKLYEQKENEENLDLLV